MTKERISNLRLMAQQYNQEQLAECLDEIERLEEALAHYKNNPPPYPDWTQLNTIECMAGGMCLGLAWRLDLKLDAHERKALEIAGKCIGRIINHQPPEGT